jgi:preprotein translocase subunit SecG
MNKRRMTATFIILFFLFALGLVHSKNARYNQFDAQSATMQIDDINHQLSIRTFNYEELYSTVKLIKGLQEQANECINNGKIQLQNIDDLLKNKGFKSLNKTKSYQ